MLLGIITDCRPLHPLNAPSPIDVTLLGITVFLHPTINLLTLDLIIALQLFRESYTVFPSSTVMEINPLQPLNASSATVVTLLGMLIEVRPIQP